MRNKRIALVAFLGILLIGLFALWVFRIFHPPARFNGQRAYKDVLAQVAFGPRLNGSQAHAKTIIYIQDKLRKTGWLTELQQTVWQGFPVENIIAFRPNQSPQIILGSHYDSRMLADQDPGPGRNQPVPGANDGASGVAILLELARTLPHNSIPVSLVFFDAEDNGDLNGQDWIMGSRAYVAALKFRPRAAIILDMVGDYDLNLYIEGNSDAKLAAEIWAQAASLNHRQQFIPAIRYSMLDDHTPFLEAGIPAVDIIDFDYPYWHTAADTPDKVSSASLQIVGETVRAWLIAQK